MHFDQEIASTSFVVTTTGKHPSSQPVASLMLRETPAGVEGFLAPHGIAPGSRPRSTLVPFAACRDGPRCKTPPEVVRGVEAPAAGGSRSGISSAPSATGVRGETNRAAVAISPDRHYGFHAGNVWTMA